VTEQRRAIGIIRVSRVRGREGESFASPAEQRERIGQACKREGLRLVGDHEELDVSGGATLDRREGLSAAVEAIEAGRADTIVVAYFDRLFRSMRVQADVLERIERAGGHVLAVDVGTVGEATAAEWLSASMHGMMSEYYKRQIGEKSVAAQRRAVKRGVPPLANIPPGYKRGPDKKLVLVPAEVPVVQEAFRMRAAGATLKEVCAYMNAHGVPRTWRSTQSLLASPVVLGEIHFGDMFLPASDPAAHRAIIDRPTFEQVQRLIVPRGRRAKSERLLARLGVLRCGTCGGKMSVGSRNKPIKTTGEHGHYPMYRCSPTSACPQRVAISAEKVEEFVHKRMREQLADKKGTADAARAAREAQQELAAAESDREGYAQVFGGRGDLDSAKDRLRELDEAVAAAQARVDQLGDGATMTMTLSGGRLWDEGTLDEKRALIRARITEITVAPGRGDKRIKVKTVGG